MDFISETSFVPGSQKKTRLRQAIQTRSSRFYPFAISCSLVPLISPGKLIGIEPHRSPGSLRHEETFESGWSDDLESADDEEKRFCSLLEQLEAAQVFEE